METKKSSPRSIDEYIGQFSSSIQEILQELRQAIQAAAPGSREKISYQMPTFWLGGNLVHFAVHKHHIGFYPTPSAIEAFREELKVYKSSKGAVQFPIGQPLPIELIRRIVKFRVAENISKSKSHEQ